MGGDNKDHEIANLVDQPNDLVMFGALLRLSSQFDQVFNCLFYHKTFSIKSI